MRITATQDEARGLSKKDLEKQSADIEPISNISGVFRGSKPFRKPTDVVVTVTGLTLSPGRFRSILFGCENRH